MNSHSILEMQRAVNTSISMTFTIPNNEIMLKIDYERQHLWNKWYNSYIMLWNRHQNKLKYIIQFDFKTKLVLDHGQLKKRAAESRFIII